MLYLHITFYLTKNVGLFSYKAKYFYNLNKETNKANIVWEVIILIDKQLL